MKHISVFLFIMIMLAGIADTALGEDKTVISNGKYVMGDRDSKTDARSIALINAKRMALEEAGTYISTTSEVQNFQLTKDEISSLAAGVVSVEVLDEKWTMEGESPVITMTIKAVINDGNLEERIESLRENEEIVEDYKNIKTEIDKLKKELEELKKQGETVQSSGEDRPVTDEQYYQKEKDTIKKIVAMESLNDVRWGLEKGNTDDAIAELNKAIELDPNNYQAYIMRSEAYEKLGRNIEALSDINTALKINHSSQKALANKGRILLRDNKPKTALKHLSKAIKLIPECGSCFYARGAVLISQNQFTQAYSDFKEACRLGVNKGCNRSRKMEKKQLKKQPDDRKKK